MTRVAMTYCLALLLPLTTQIKDLMSGHHIIIASNLRLLTSYSTEIRCLLGISTSYSASGLHLLPSTVINHHFQRLPMCTTLSIPLLLVTLHGNHLAYSIMELNLNGMFCHGCKLNMMSGSRIHVLWFTTSCLIQISSLTLIIHHFKSTQVMESIAFKTLCLKIGPGIKQ